MNKHFLALVNALRNTFFGNNPNQGDTPSDLRCAVEQYATHLSAPHQPTATVPNDLHAYIQKVARHAHKITDDDVDALKLAGYSEDELFEITISAALGAGRIRLEAGLAALHGESAHAEAIDVLATHGK